MFLIIDIYRLGVVYPYLSTSISLDECDYYRYISHIIINVINNDEEIYIAIYLPKKFPDDSHWILLMKRTDHYPKVSFLVQVRDLLVFGKRYIKTILDIYLYSFRLLRV